MENSIFRFVIVITCLIALAAALPVAATQTSSSKTTTAKTASIDINSATKAQLMALPGITATRADKIIAGRPYKTVNELVTKRILPATTYKQVGKRMVARPLKADAATAPVTIPAGTKITIRLVDPIDSAVNKTGDAFRGSLETPIVVNGKEIVPKHADVTGLVVNVESAGHFTGRSELGLVLTKITAGERSFSLKTQALAKEASSRGVRSAVVIGGGAAAGALIGAIAGGGKGAAIGVAAGAGAGTGVQALTKSEQVQFPSETILEFELQEATASTPTASSVTPAKPSAVTRTFDEVSPASTGSSTSVESMTTKAKDTLSATSTTVAAVAPAITTAPVPDVSKTAQPNVPSNAPSLTSDKITAGLKEALAVGTGNAVALTGKPDGFLGNSAIRIPLPDQLKSLGSGARYLGMGSQVDQLEIGMNRAAEQASPQAKKIFLEALTKMPFADARKIWSGGDMAATEYFKAQTTSQLTTAFKPIVHSAMENVGVVKQYNAITQSPIAGTLGLQGFSLDDYVVGKSLDGLFYMLGEEEKKIRKEPLAQTTSLLKEVFGKKP